MTFRVSTVNLSADARIADPTLEPSDLGEISRAELMVLLERFGRLNPTQDREIEPHILVAGPAGKFLIRTSRGKLFLYNARAAIEPYAQLSAAEIIHQLERKSVTESPFTAGSDTPSSSVRSAPHRGIAAAILIAGVALNGYTLYAVFYTQSVNEKPIITLITNATELAARQHDIVGTYATGDRPGDRTITVQANGEIRFSELGSKNSVVNNRDKFRLGLNGKRFCLATDESGVVEILNIDTLLYYRDSYTRIK